MSTLTASSDSVVVLTADERTALRYSARRILWKKSSIERVRSCGHHAVSEGGNVAVKLSGSGENKKAGFSGVATCGSVWACPVCNSKISAVRAGEITKAIDAWHALGGRVLFSTFTTRHSKSQSLKMVFDAVSYAWSAMTSGKGWESINNIYGDKFTRTVKSVTVLDREGEKISVPLKETVRVPGSKTPLVVYDATYTVTKHRVGYVKVVEVTQGKNGWHVHIHALLFVRNLADGFFTVDESAEQLSGSLFARWSRALQRRGFRSPSPKYGTDVRVVPLGGSGGPLGKYFTKSTYGAGWEAAGGMGKTARGENRTPFQILADLVNSPVCDSDGVVSEDQALWWEWEYVSSGRRQITWSAGLRETLDMTAEMTDEEIAEADELAGDVVLTLTSGEYAVIRWYAEMLLAILEAADKTVQDAQNWVDRKLAQAGYTSESGVRLQYGTETV